MTPPAFVRIRDLTKSYGAARVLDGISLDIREGETRCIIGPSGSGKSTLLRCINALTDFDGGALVRFDDGLLWWLDEYHVLTYERIL